MYSNKEIQEENRQKRYLNEKLIYEQNRERREKIRKMSQLSHNRARAYEIFIKNKTENLKKKEEDSQLDLIQNKDEYIKTLLETEEEMIFKLNQVRHAKKGMEKHYSDYVFRKGKGSNG